jgi:enoyl-CoA hydratase/carnithine racemase
MGAILPGLVFIKKEEKMAVEITINRSTKTMVMPQGEAEKIKEIVGGRIRKVGALTSAGGTNRWVAGGDLEELAGLLREAGYDVHLVGQPMVYEEDDDQWW